MASTPLRSKHIAIPVFAGPLAHSGAGPALSLPRIACALLVLLGEVAVLLFCVRLSALLGMSLVDSFLGVSLELLSFGFRPACPRCDGDLTPQATDEGRCPLTT